MIRLDLKRRETLGILPALSAPVSRASAITPNTPANANANANARGSSLAPAPTCAPPSAAPSSASFERQLQELDAPEEEAPASFTSQLWKLSPLKRPQPNNVKDWRLRACLAWLECEANLAEYCTVFETAKIDGSKLLKLNEAELERIGITDPIDQEILLARLQRLSYHSGETSPRSGSFTDPMVICPTVIDPDTSDVVTRVTEPVKRA